MTGTADTEATEFKKIYDLDVVVIPTNMPMIRIDFPDAIYKSRKEKFDAAIDEIIELNKTGQPVLVGGTMGTSSWILAGTEKAETQTFSSALHGAGRVLSRKQATKQFWGETIIQELGQRGTLVRAHSRKGVAEEAPGAYKDVDRVVEIMTRAGIVRPVARVLPLICIKG